VPGKSHRRKSAAGATALPGYHVLPYKASLLVNPLTGRVNGLHVEIANLGPGKGREKQRDLLLPYRYT
jgi:hypothetical protein